MTYLLLLGVLSLSVTGQQVHPSKPGMVRVVCLQRCPALEEMNRYQGVQVGKEVSG